jgi:hypothetical protein
MLADRGYRQGSRISCRGDRGQYGPVVLHDDNDFELIAEVTGQRDAAADALIAWPRGRPRWLVHGTLSMWDADRFGQM